MNRQSKCPGAGRPDAFAKVHAGGEVPCPVCGKRVRAKLDGTIGYHTSAVVKVERREPIDYIETETGFVPVYADES
jgi:uncharacterized Zn finger protein (UPF0148 family)